MIILEGKLYGVITKILKDNEFCLCEPVFTNCFEQDNKYYKAIFEEGSYKKKAIKFVSYFEEFDISKYGLPLSLPISKMNVNDDNLHIVLFEPNKNEFNNKKNNDVIVVANDSPFIFTPSLITVGIKFPNKFVFALKDLSKDELSKYI